MGKKLDLSDIVVGGDQVAPDCVKELVEHFSFNREAYRSDAYNETQTRQEFIDPLFEAMGWDIYNRQHYAEPYKQVIFEDAIKVGGMTKAPDYCFRVGGQRKFFVEAKKPFHDLARDPSLAFQLRRYAYSARLPLSILTDFQEFAVYDGLVAPKNGDTAGSARVLYITYEDYVDRWGELVGIFSPDAIQHGSFDKFAESRKARRGTAPVDEAFLKDIESWRDVLAHNIALRNPELSQRELNFAVGRTIDRIIFLRMCEDRGIDEYGRLAALQNGQNVYPRVCELYNRADERYNSGLFHFRVEKGRPEPDTLTPKLNIDDKVLKDILKRLYYPDSPYEFSVLPAEILGQVYEQFLGKVIRLTPAHRAVVEDKPEVKKAGGVYYTPRYIVDYIVEHTVGELLKGKEPRDVAGIGRHARPLRVLDPACGSGSFLIGAYQRLLDWHLEWYERNVVPLLDGGAMPESAGVRALVPQRSRERAELPIHKAAGGGWRLTTGERKRILLNSIYGVDIDPQAVEVTKLSLLLKVLEGETQEVLDRQQKMFHERALPDLASNIKCGNSLIGPDFYGEGQSKLFDEEEVLRVNAFDWKAEFPEVFGVEDQGFDAVIGNPPYGAFISEAEVSYCRRHFAAAQGTCDTYALFLERGGDLLGAGGRAGMIVQSGWVSAPAMKALRLAFLEHFTLKRFATMPYDVFGAYVDTVIVIAEKRPASLGVQSGAEPVALTVFPVRYSVRSVVDFDGFIKEADATKWRADPEAVFLITTSEAEREVMGRIQAAGRRFSDVADIQRGITPFEPQVFPPEKSPRRAFTGTVRRYELLSGEEEYVRYDESLAEYKPERYFRGPRLLLRELISRQFRLQAVYAEEDFVTNKSMQSILLTDDRYDLRYLLALLNSKLISWYFLAVSSVARRDDFPKIVLKQTRSLPFRGIDFADETDRARHDTAAGLAAKLQEARARLACAAQPDREALQRQWQALDQQLDKNVYALYGLTSDEMAIVEESLQDPKD